MNDQRVRLFSVTGRRFFAQKDLPFIVWNLEMLPDDRFVYLQTIDFKDPNTALAISFFAGLWGIDRFYVEDIALGILKLITFGGLGLWWLIDLVIIRARARKHNLEKISLLF